MKYVGKDGNQPISSFPSVHRSWRARRTRSPVSGATTANVACPAKSVVPVPTVSQRLPSTRCCRLITRPAKAGGVPMDDRTAGVVSTTTLNGRPGSTW